MKKLFLIFVLVGLSVPGFSYYKKVQGWGRQKPPVGSQLNWGDPINNGIRGCWLLNESGGTNAFDIARKYKGTLTNGPTWSNGKFGNALSFDASNDSLNMGTADDSMLKENEAFTFSCWMYPKTLGQSNAGAPFDRSADGGSFTARLIATNAIRFRIGGGTVLTRLTSNNAFVFNAWSHFVITHDGSVTAANCHIYINGVETTYATTTNGATPTDNSASSVIIGNRVDSLTTWDGFLDNIRIYGRQLSPSEVRRLFEEPFAGVTALRHGIVHRATAVAAPASNPNLIIRNGLMKIINGRMIIKD